MSQQARLVLNISQFILKSLERARPIACSYEMNVPIRPQRHTVLVRTGVEAAKCRRHREKGEGSERERRENHLARRWHSCDSEEGGGRAFWLKRPEGRRPSAGSKDCTFRKGVPESELRTFGEDSLSRG